MARLVLSQELAFKGNHIQVRLDRVMDPAGKVWTKEIVIQSEAICVVAVLDDGNVVLVRQYRYPAGKELLEICAGGLNVGEDPVEGAIRELEEETGYRAANMVERARFWTTPGFTTEFMYLYEATGLVKTQIHPDEDESIEVEVVTPQEALIMIDDGRIQDAKSILGLQRVLSRR